MNPAAATAIIPNWNGQVLLEKLLKDLPNQSEPFDRVFVVDNGSTDDSVKTAQRLGAEVIRFERNLGFAPAVNAGVARSITPLVAVLNNDVRLHRDWLASLKPELLDGKISGACGKILQEKQQKRIDGTFDAISRAGCAWRCGSDREDGPMWNIKRQVSLIPFTAAVFRRTAWEDIGGLDIRFESYLEDVDFGIRAASKGYTGIYQPAAIAWHQGSATRGMWHPATTRQISRNQVWIIAKHYSEKALLRYGWPIAIGQAAWGLVAIRHGSGIAFLRGKIEGVFGVGSMRSEARFAPEDFFAQSENDIRELQQAVGMDPYWRLYFAIT